MLRYRGIFHFSCPHGPCSAHPDGLVGCLWALGNVFVGVIGLFLDARFMRPRWLKDRGRVLREQEPTNGYRWGMCPNNEAIGPQPLGSAVPAPNEEPGGPLACGGGDGFLGRFPEAVAAGALADGPQTPRRSSALGFRIALYSSLAVGAVAGLSLIAAWILQAVLTGSYIRAGGDYFSSGIEATAARELLSIPVGGLVLVLFLCLGGMCVGTWGIQRSKGV